MEKNAAIKPGTTPDVEHKLPTEKKAGADPSVLRREIKALDDDATHRLAEAASKR